MSDDLHAQIAQRLFGWMETGVRWDPQQPQSLVWEDPHGLLHWILPAYTYDPAATALVWQWLEARLPFITTVTFWYRHDVIQCSITCASRRTVYGQGVSRQEALCRAALFLAEALAAGEGEV